MSHAVFVNNSIIFCQQRVKFTILAATADEGNTVIVVYNSRTSRGASIRAAEVSVRWCYAKYKVREEKKCVAC